MHGKLFTGGGLVLAVVLLMALNILSNTALKGARLDLTENGLFTLSEGTRKVLSSLDEPITLRLFLSQRMATRLPGIAGYAARVRELLEEFRYAAGGKLTVTLIEPEPFSEQEDRAVGYGLRGIPLDDESIFYFGLVGTNSTDDQEVIPFLSTEREEFIEYDLSRMIHSLANPERKVIGLLSSLPIYGLGPRAIMSGQISRPWMVMEQVQQLFEVRSIDAAATEIPDDVSVLMIVHPKGLGEQTLYAIDQFVLRGGHALVFVDPYAESDRGRQPGMAGMMLPPGSSDLGKLLKAWGVELEPSKVAGDLELAVQVRTERDGRAIQLDYPVWMNVPPALLNADDIVTGKLGSLAFGSAGLLKTVNGAGTTVTPLVETTTAAMRIDTSKLGFASDPREILRAYRAGGERLALAVRVTGKATSAFPDGAPAGEAEEKEQEKTEAAADPKAAGKQHLAESTGDVNLIIVADTDLLRDQFWVRVQDFLGTRIAIPTAANGGFVVNALDNLTGSGDLISVRSRGRFLRPFTRVNAIRQQAELRFRQKEQELIDRLEETERKLGEMESGKRQTGEALVLSEAQRQELRRFRDEKVRIRKELRDVRHALRKNIERLEGWLKFINIALVPILIGLGGLAAGVYRLRRRRVLPRPLPAAA